MKKRTFFLILISLALLQATLMQGFKFFYVLPELLVIGMVAACFMYEARWALMFGCFSGMLKDVLSVQSFGIHTVLFAAWSYLIIMLLRKVSLENDFVRALLVGIVVFFNALIMRFMSLSSGITIPGGIFTRGVILEPVYSGLVAFFLLKVLSNENPRS